MTTAFVLSGGGSLGAIQVGMLQALVEAGITPDVLYGTSVGALNAAFVAGAGATSGHLEDLADLWRSIQRRDIFPVVPRRGVRAILGRAPSLFSDHPLRRLVEANLGYADIERAAVPLHLVAADLVSGEAVLLSTGDVVSAVAASAAVPGLLPPVLREGRTLVDGGIAEHDVLMTATERGADEIYLLPAGYPCATATPPDSAIAVTLHALSVLVHQQLTGEVRRYAGSATLRVLPPLCPLGVSPADFTHSGELIRRARQTSARWLDSDAARRGGDPVSVPAGQPREIA